MSIIAFRKSTVLAGRRSRSSVRVGGSPMSMPGMTATLYVGYSIVPTGLGYIIAGWWPGAAIGAGLGIAMAAYTQYQMSRLIDGAP